MNGNTQCLWPNGRCAVFSLRAATQTNSRKHRRPRRSTSADSGATGRRSLARDVLLHIFHSFLDDFLHIADDLLRLAFILFGETLDLLISAPNHLPGFFLHLAGDLFDLTLNLILVHDISLRDNGKDGWPVSHSDGPGPGNPL